MKLEGKIAKLNLTKGDCEMKNLHYLKYVALFFFGLILITGCNQTEAPTAPDTPDAGQQSLLKSSDDDERLGFIFASLSDGPTVGGVHHQIFMTGSGKFDRKRVRGGGFYNRTDANSGPPPLTILETGTWKARRLISFTKTPADEPKMNPSGFNTSGILEIEARLFPENGPRHGIKATLKIICNIPPEGLFTGLPEGYFLNIQDGLSFEPATFPGGFPVGATAFTPR
jgi:hypothetical protein